MYGINQQTMQTIMNSFGGPEPFQKAMNTAQNSLMQSNVTMEQFMQNPQQIAQQLIPQDRLDYAIQMANKMTGR